MGCDPRSGPPLEMYLTIKVLCTPHISIYSTNISFLTKYKKMLCTPHVDVYTFKLIGKKKRKKKEKRRVR